MFKCLQARRISQRAVFFVTRRNEFRGFKRGTGNLIVLDTLCDKRRYRRSRGDSLVLGRDA